MTGGEQLNQSNPAKSDLSSVHVYSGVHLTSHFLQGTRKTWPCLTGHSVGNCKYSELVGCQSDTQLSLFLLNFQEIFISPDIYVY